MTEDYTATLPRKRMGAAVLFTDGAGRVLLVEPVYKDYWEIVGGCVDENESPFHAAVREVKEELGHSVDPGRVLINDWVPPRPGRTEGFMIIFDGGTLSAAQTAAIQLPPEELSSWAWCTEEDIAAKMSELLARRVIAAMRAKAEGATYFLENGFRVA